MEVAELVEELALELVVELALVLAEAFDVEEELCWGAIGREHATKRIRQMAMTPMMMPMTRGR